MAKLATFTTELGTKTWEISADKIVDLKDFSTAYTAKTDDNEAVEGEVNPKVWTKIQLNCLVMSSVLYRTHSF